MRVQVLTALMLSLLSAAGAQTGTAQAQTQTAAPTSAQQAAVAQTLTRVFGAETVDAALFAPEFLAAVPVTALNETLAGVRTGFGAFVRIDVSGAVPQVIYERGALNVTQFAVNAQGLITALVIAPASPEGNVQDAAALLTRVFEPQTVDAALFATAFLAQVPVTALNELLADLRAQFGAFVRVDTSGPVPQVIYERGALNVTQFAVDAQGLITALVIAPVTPEVSFGSPQEAQAAFAALPGQVSLLVREVGAAQPLAALNPGRLLAVGSTFKLAILGELQAQITRGERAWTDEVMLTDADRSLPSGTLQDAPPESRYSLRDLATRMIAGSDNTATDLLLRVVGRAGVAARFGQTALPSTREAFALKNPANLELLRAYRSAGLDRGARRTVLAQAATAPLPGAALFAAGPVARDVEWFASTERLCTLLADVAALPETQLNPGVAAPADFARVSYKGGSEGGVLNLTTQVTNRAGKTYCVSATWNDARLLNDAGFFALYGGVLKLLR
jgi:beta-lactamase class A